MKANIKFFAIKATAIIIFGSIILVSCKKDVSLYDEKTARMEPTHVENVGKSITTVDHFPNIGSSINPYDKHGYLIIDFFDKLSAYISSSDNLSYEQVRSYANTLLDSIYSYYPTLPAKRIESLDTSILLSIVRQILNSEEDNTLYAAQQAEMFVLESAMDLDSKDAFFQIISELKFCMIAYTTIEDLTAENIASNHQNPNNYEQRVDNCIGYETSQIFDHGSWLKQAIFIAGLPGSFIEIAVECMAVAATNPDDPRMF